MENDSFSGRAHFSVISDAIVAANDVNRLTIADYTPSLSLRLGFLRYRIVIVDFDKLLQYLGST